MSARSKQAFLETYDNEHATTMRLLRAYPEDKGDLKPAEKLKNARDLAFMFVLEAGLGAKVWQDEFGQKTPPPRATPPAAPEKWSDLIAAVEKAQADFRALVANTSEEDLQKEVHFFVGPKKMGTYTRMNFAWFLLHDQIHHRGQFSVYARIAGAKMPSIYGPTADEPWI